MKHTDPYWKLRPEGAAPAEELCRCTGSPPVAVRYHLSSVPLACLSCNGEVPPERIGFSEALAERLAVWRDVCGALETLWLASGEYEVWARVRLEDPEGQVNTEGLELVAELNRYRRTFYWWFQDEAARDFIPLSSCPRCEHELVEYLAHRVCEGCSIVIPRTAPGDRAAASVDLG